MKNNNMTAAAQNAINGINLYNSIKKTFNDYTEIQEKTKTWKPGEYSACMIMRAVETSSDNFSVGISYTDNGWLISACIVKGFYAGYYRENVPFDFTADETAFFDSVYDACVSVLRKEAIRNEELALAEERAEARIAEMETNSVAETEINRIKTELESSFEKLDDTDYDDIVSDKLFGDFEIICTHASTSVDSFMNVEVVLSSQGEKKYTTDAFERWSVGFEIRYDNEIADIATKITDIMAEADKLMFQKGKTYIGSDGKPYKLVDCTHTYMLIDCTHNWLPVHFGVFVDEDGNEIKGRIGKDASVITLLGTETDIRPSGLVED